jgi:protein-disulfide isomerase
MKASLLTAASCGLLALAAPLAAQSLSDMSDAERAAFRAEVRAYLLENPEVLMEAIGVLESRQAEEQAAADTDLLAQNADALFNDPSSWVGGNPEGEITVVEFLDYRCGYCRRAHPDVAELIAQDKEIRLIVKEYPILGDESVLASRFALGVRAVEGDAAYKIANDRLMTFRGTFSEQSLSDLSEELGFDTPKVFDAMNSDEIRDTIVRNQALAQRLSINGTPSFVFGDQVVRGYVPLAGMQEIVEQLRADG